MENNSTFQYLKLILDYIPFWSVLLLFFVYWAYKNPEWLKKIPNYISSAKIGEFEIQLRKVEQKLAETEQHVSELEEENQKLNDLYAAFDSDASVEALKATRGELKALAGNLEDMEPVLEGLKKGALPEDVYAAAEILRARRDLSVFDKLIDALDRIASDAKLEGLRYHTVWTMASAAHRTILAAVKHSAVPKLSKDQLGRADQVMIKLSENPHVKLDRPDMPKKGIRGPAAYARDWIEKGISKFEKLDT